MFSNNLMVLRSKGKPLESYTKALWDKRLVRDNHSSLFVFRTTDKERSSKNWHQVWMSFFFLCHRCCRQV